MTKRSKKLIATVLTAILMANSLSITSLALSRPAYIYARGVDENATFNEPKTINYDSIIDVSDIIPPVKRQTYLVHFNKRLSIGYAEDGTLINCEAEYGLTGEIKNNKICVKTYNHTGKNLKTNTVLKNLNDNSSLNINITNSYAALAFQNRKQGIYEIKTQFKSKKSVSLYLYISASQEVYFCDIMESSLTACQIYQQRRASLEKLLKNINPSDHLNYKNIAYPTDDKSRRHRNDNVLWAEKSKDLCSNKDSNEYKVYKIYKWLINNISYDYYRVDKLNKSRASYYNDYSGKYSTYDTMTGVCIDFANIFAIMCRYQNIPTVTIGSESSNHVWNAIYINGNWHEIDVSSHTKYGSYNIDPSDKEIVEEHYLYDFFFNFLPFRRANMPDDATVNKYLF